MQHAGKRRANPEPRRTLVGVRVDESQLVLEALLLLDAALELRHGNEHAIERYAVVRERALELEVRQPAHECRCVRADLLPPWRWLLPASRGCRCGHNGQHAAELRSSWPSGA